MAVKKTPEQNVEALAEEIETSITDCVAEVMETAAGTQDLMMLVAASLKRQSNEIAREINKSIRARVAALSKGGKGSAE